MFLLKNFSATVLLAVSFAICVKAQLHYYQNMIVINDKCPSTNYSNLGTPIMLMTYPMPIKGINETTQIAPDISYQGSNGDFLMTYALYDNKDLNITVYYELSDTLNFSASGMPKIMITLKNTNVTDGIPAPAVRESSAEIRVDGPPSNNTVPVQFKFVVPGFRNVTNVCGGTAGCEKASNCHMTELQCPYSNLGLNITFCGN